MAEDRTKKENEVVVKVDEVVYEDPKIVDDLKPGTLDVELSSETHSLSEQSWEEIERKISLDFGETIKFEQHGEKVIVLLGSKRIMTLSKKQSQKLISNGFAGDEFVKVTGIVKKEKWKKQVIEENKEKFNAALIAGLLGALALLTTLALILGNIVLPFGLGFGFGRFGEWIKNLFGGGSKKTEASNLKDPQEIVETFDSSQLGLDETQKITVTPDGNFQFVMGGNVYTTTKDGKVLDKDGHIFTITNDGKLIDQDGKVYGDVTFLNGSKTNENDTPALQDGSTDVIGSDTVGESYGEQTVDNINIQKRIAVKQYFDEIFTAAPQTIREMQDQHMSYSYDLEIIESGYRTDYGKVSQEIEQGASFLEEVSSFKTKYENIENLTEEQFQQYLEEAKVLMEKYFYFVSKDKEYCEKHLETTEQRIQNGLEKSVDLNAERTITGAQLELINGQVKNIETALSVIVEFDVIQQMIEDGSLSFMNNGFVKYNNGEQSEVYSSLGDFIIAHENTFVRK